MHIGTVIREVELMPAAATTTEPGTPEAEAQELPAAASVDREPVGVGER
jgi:exosome complex RNA-binding protein Rrp42 (RNase PH superfamily)